jgi:hydrogenase maturation factor HypF (carbamoyltransferase family)
MTDEICAICGIANFSFAMKTCPMCKKRYCDHCEYRMGGNTFCSKACGQMFFFSGEDGTDEE